MECNKLRYLNPIYIIPRALSADLKRCKLKTIIERVMLSLAAAFLSMKLGAAPLLLSKFTYLQSIALLSSTAFFSGAFSLGILWLLQKNLNREEIGSYEKFVYHRHAPKTRQA